MFFCTLVTADYFRGHSSLGFLYFWQLSVFKELLSAFEWFEEVLKDSLSEKDLDFVSLFKKYDKIADISKELNWFGGYNI